MTPALMRDALKQLTQLAVEAERSGRTATAFSVPNAQEIAQKRVETFTEVLVHAVYGRDS